MEISLCYHRNQMSRYNLRILDTHNLLFEVCNGSFIACLSCIFTSKCQFSIISSRFPRLHSLCENVRYASFYIFFMYIINGLQIYTQDDISVSSGHQCLSGLQTTLEQKRSFWPQFGPQFYFSEVLVLLDVRLCPKLQS